MKVYVIVCLYGSLLDHVEVYTTRSKAKAVIDAHRKELGERLDPDCPDDCAWDCGLEEEWHLEEAEVTQ